jgi:hypothetical protein
MAQIKIAGYTDHVKVRNVPSGSFSVRTADHQNSRRGRRSRERIWGCILPAFWRHTAMTRETIDFGKTGDDGGCCENLE